MKLTSVSARLVGLLAALLLIVSALAAPPALAKAACDSAQPKADIALVQAILASGGHYIDHLTITNYGPCNVPNAELHATLPSPLVAFSSNPNSWTCTKPDGVTTAVNCSETSTIGVPGTADIYLEYAPATGDPILACAAVAPSLTACPPTPAELASDLDPTNNTSTVAGGLLAARGTLVYGPGGQPIPNSAITHTTSVTLANGGLVNIYQSGGRFIGDGCPPTGPTDCFLGTATINFTNVSGQKTWTLTFFASLTQKVLSQITVWNSTGGAYTALSNCNGKQQTDPCVSSRSRSTSNGETIYTIVVTGTKDNGMTAD